MGHRVFFCQNSKSMNRSVLPKPLVPRLEVADTEGTAELQEGRASLGRIPDRLDTASLATAIEEATLPGRVGSGRRQRIAEWARTVFSGEGLCGCSLKIVAGAGSDATSAPRAPRESGQQEFDRQLNRI